MSFDPDVMDKNWLQIWNQRKNSFKKVDCHFCLNFAVDQCNCFSISLGKKDLVLLLTPKQRDNLDSSEAMCCLNCNLLSKIMPRYLTALTILIGE